MTVDVELGVGTADQRSELTSKRYQSNVGSFLYLATKARPELCHTASVLGLHVSNSTRTQALGVNRVLLCLKGSEHIRMHLGIGDLEQLNSYVDSSWGAELGSTRCRRTGILINFCLSPNLCRNCTVKVHCNEFYGG